MPTSLNGVVNPRWESRYFKNEYLRYDICVYLINQTTKCFTWKDALDGVNAKKFKVPNVKIGHKIINEASEYQLHSGFTLPLHRLDGSKSAVTVLSTNPVHEISHEEKFALQMIMIFYSGAMHKLLGKNYHKKKYYLTKRQREVLAYISAGKRYDDISIILGISIKTVRRHVEDARKSFNVITTPQLVAEAIKIGEIIP